MTRGRKKKKPELMPSPAPGVIRITLRDGATGQLETAIRLWFDGQDAASIHTLATAAQGMLDAMCGRKKIKASDANIALKSFPSEIADFLRSPQNFFKHGHHKQEFEGVVSLARTHTELILWDCLSMYERLFGRVTPLMDDCGKIILPRLEEIKNKASSGSSRLSTEN